MSDELRAFLANARTQRGGILAGSAAKVISLDDLQPGHSIGAEPWGLPALRGRLVELSARGASATLSTAIDIVLEAQREGEPVAWIVPWTLVIGDKGHDRTAGTFYPPDAADSGVDLAALVVVRAPSAIAAARSAERLLRSGAFGLVVLDFGSGAVELPMAHQGRLVTLAQAHDAAIVCLTEKTSESGSLGSLVSLRAEALRTRASARAMDGYEVTVRALKDKRRGPGWIRASKLRGPAGM